MQTLVTNYQTIDNKNYKCGTKIKIRLHDVIVNGVKVNAGISARLEFNSSFLNETNADIVAAQLQVRNPYWLPKA